MAVDGSSWAVPNLAGRPFCEKPPLYFWSAAASVRAFGRSPAAVRAPNLVYAASDLEKFGYDAVGNLTNYITRASQTNRYVYDPANRLTNITYNGASDVISFGYDAGNQLTNALWKVGTATNSLVTFRYDLNGRLTNETQKITTAAAKTAGYDYDAACARTSRICRSRFCVRWDCRRATSAAISKRVRRRVRRSSRARMRRTRGWRSIVPASAGLTWT